MNEQLNQVLASYFEALKGAGVTPQMLAKSFVQAGSPTSGLTFYDLEAGAKLLFPVITPLIQMIPRVQGRGGTATNWRAVTGINSGTLPMGVSEGLRGGVVATTTQDNTASYVTIGLEDTVSFEADLASVGFDDLRALAVGNLLRASRIGEESLVIGGLGTYGLGTTNATTLTASTTGGTITSATYNVRAVALSASAFARASMTAGIPTTQIYKIGDNTSATVNAGAAQVSANNSVAVTGPNGSIRAFTSALKGAVAYAWFIGTDGSTNCSLVAITTTNLVSISALAGAITPPTGFVNTVGTSFSGDQSRNSLVFDGLISIIAKSGSNAYFSSLDGAALTADTAGGITEVNTALKSFWDNFRLGPDLMLVSSQELDNITKKVIAAGGTPLFRFLMDNASAGQALQITAGAVVGTYLNKFTMEGGRLMKVMLHPNVPAGTIIFYSKSIPYPLSNVQNVLQVKTRRDWYQLEWPLRNRQYEYGVYADEVLQCYFPPAFGMICNIANG